MRPLLLILVAACSPIQDPATPTSDGATTTSVAPTTTLPLVAGCPGEGEFSEGVPIAEMDYPGSDSDVIGTISWVETEACETFTVEFETSEGAPPTTPPTFSAGYVEGIPVIRVNLGVAATAITDGLVESALVDRMFVVRRLEGGMFIDFHLAAPAQARVTTDTSPARLVLQLQPGIVDYPQLPVLTEHTVLLTPLDGASIDQPTVFIGYARTFESNVLLIATSNGQVVYEAATTAADSIDTWGEYFFEASLPDEELSVFVGEESAVDGSLEGVTITLGSS